LLVHHFKVRVADYPDDGVYTLVDLGSAGAARGYLQRFAKNPRALKVLEALVDEMEDEEDEEEETSAPLRPGSSSGPKLAVKQQQVKRDVLSEVAGLIAEGELGIAEQLARFNPPTKLDERVEAAAVQQPPTPPPAAKKLTYIEIKIVDDVSGKPVNWVRMILKTPDGNETFQTTNSNGIVRIDDLEQGTCDVRCDLKNAKLADTLHFCGEGEPKTKGGAGNGNGAAPTSTVRIAEIEIHKVKKGESIKSLAEGVGLKWQELAKFNWDTDVPNEINKHLRDEVGCTKKTKDGYNYMFDDSDNPGIMHIPKAWSKTGLATGQTHVFRVKKIKGGPILRFVLESSITGHLLPFHPFKVFDMSDKEIASGTTNECAMATVEVPKDGDYQVMAGEGKTFGVSGKIHHPDSKTPLANAEVEVVAWECEKLSVKTGPGGEIELSEVPAGEMVIIYQGKEHHMVVSEEITDGFFFVPGVVQETPEAPEVESPPEDVESGAGIGSAGGAEEEEPGLNMEDF
jgi:hypothetical protein